MNSFVRKQLKKVNRRFERWMEKRSREVQKPENVEEFSDIPYRDTGLDCHRMDVFRPKTAGEKLPVVLNFHGGGMVLCTRKVNVPFCRELAKRGFLVFSIDYPLVPDADVPGLLRDAARGMDRVAELLAEFGGDPERVYLAGDSAGAFIGLYEIAARENKAIAESLNLKPTTLKIKAAAFISGMFYTARTDSTGAFLRSDFYGKNWRKHSFRPYMDPAVKEVAGNLPPVYLVTAKLDNLRDYTMDFARGLKKAGKTYRLLDLPARKELVHDFVIIKPEAEKAQQVINGICEFFQNT